MYALDVQYNVQPALTLTPVNHASQRITYLMVYVQAAASLQEL